MDAVRAGDGAELYTIDGQEPDLVVEPRDLTSMANVLADAGASGMAVVPLGGGEHRTLGNTTAAYDVALSTVRLNSVVAYEPDDLTITVQAGVRLGALREVLEPNRQFLPLDPACSDDATVGGVVSANASGPLRHGFGSARDWLIGARVAHADGSISKCGGRVVKNVAGYDMAKLYVGSLGTLGVIGEMTFKVAPQPVEEETGIAWFASAGQAAAFAMDAHNAGLAIHAMELLSPPGGYAVSGEPRWQVLLRMAGGAAAVERTRRDVRRLIAAYGGRMELLETAFAWKAWKDAFRVETLALRINVLPSHVAMTMELLDRRFVGAAALLSATFSAGLIRAKLQPSRAARAESLVQNALEIAGRTGGNVTVEAAPFYLKRQLDVFGPLRPDFGIMRRLKEQLDPSGTLSPGRFMGRL